MARDDAEARLDAWFKSIPAGFQDCRDLGHHWRPFTGHWNGEGWQRVLRCVRCDTERVQVITALGHVLSNRYHYPTDYQAPKGNAGRMNRDSFRAAALVRLLGKRKTSWQER